MALTTVLVAEHRGSPRSAALVEEAGSTDTEKGIDPECRLHQIIEAAGEFCTVVDADWLRVADCYRVDSHALRTI